MISRWTRKIREAYEFAHSPPFTPEKYNREPVFPDALYIYMEIEDQTPDRLRQAYNSNERKSLRTKIFEHELFCVL